MSLQNLQAEIAALLTTDSECHVAVATPIAHLSIYQNTIITNLTQALMDTYPLITKLLGEDFFQITAKEYIKRYPSCSGNLLDYGEYFSDFLAEYAHVSHLPYLAEVAQFEWISHTLFFAADYPAFDITLLEKISPSQYDNLHFILHPASHLKHFHFPILSIIDLCQGELDKTVNLDEGGVHLLIIRRHLDISLVPLTLGEYTFLSALSENMPLSIALDATIRLDTSFNLEEKLQHWIKDKTIVDCFE